MSIDILSGRYQDKPPTGVAEIIGEAPLQIVGAGVHGKFIYMILQDEWSVWNTLGMTGSWSEEPRAHPRIRLVLNDGEIYFNDTRNFGTIKFVKGKFQLIKKLKSLGPDILTEDMEDRHFIDRLRVYPNRQITTAIMDQSVIAGVGNYIKSESLWLARISPRRKISELSDEQLSRLSSAIKQVMRESFRSSGTTIMVYSKYNEGEDYDRRFLVYNQKQDPDGNEVIRETTEDQRTTHWCPAVQS